MTTSEMIERVGDALAVVCQKEFGSSWSNDVRWRLAQAAIDAMGVWRPIETAPRDGTPIIAWWPHLTRPVVAWFYRTHWCFSKDKRQTFTIRSAPTVWMPLPKPPVQP